MAAVIVFFIITPLSVYAAISLCNFGFDGLFARVEEGRVLIDRDGMITSDI